MKLERTYLSAILKWELIVDLWNYRHSYMMNMTAILKLLPQLKNYPSYCSFCYVWHNPQCHNCPLGLEWGHDCREIDSLYDRWFIATDEKIGAEYIAEQIRDSVKKIYLKKGGADYENTKELLNRYTFL